MKKLVCDVCGKEIDERNCYDEDGYSKYVNVEIRNSRKYGDEYDICNECYESILNYAKNMRKEDPRESD